MAQGFLIGENLLGQIKDTVKRVQGEPMVGNMSRIETRFESIPAASSSKTFRVCTFTGAWAINGEKTVTFRGVTSTPNTVSATNLFFPITNTATATRDCAIAKDGTAWYLIDVPMATATAIFVTSTSSMAFVSGTAAGTVVTDVLLSASLNTSDCTITIGKTLTTASQTFVSSTATAVFVTGTVTATYLTFG
jgi:hypothetical protein